VEEHLTKQSIIRWTEGGEARAARWRSESGVPPHKRVVIADEQMTADAAYRLACEGTALLWRGDFQNARQMLIAMARRVDAKTKEKLRAAKKPGAKKTASGRVTSTAPTVAAPPTEAFHLHRLAQSQRARTLGMLLLPLAGDYSVPLRRAPGLQKACEEAYGPPDEATINETMGTVSLVSMREVLGLIGAHEWRRKGVEVPALGEYIYPHYGVFAPVRSEYVDLVAAAPLPAPKSRAKEKDAKEKILPLAFDIGTGTGVLAAVLAQRGVTRIIATDMDPRALACASENIRRLDFAPQVQFVEADLFPEGKAPLIVCNPPWIPARPSSPIESAIYDPESRMLRGFIAGLAAHLTPGGEGWLIMSDIAEHLGLRTREELLGYIEQGGLTVIDRLDVRPTHPRASDTGDALHAARAAEVTSLWRLGVR
jgi:methylase of polypeptide subunit release factors